MVSRKKTSDKKRTGKLTVKKDTIKSLDVKSNSGNVRGGRCSVGGPTVVPSDVCTKMR
jgi:hypothetical protein